MNKFQNCKMYKFLAVLGFLEIILIPLCLVHVYRIEHIPLRPYGTVFTAVCLSIILCPVNWFFAGLLFCEKKFRKNLPDICRTKLIKIGFGVYVFDTVIISLWFLFSLYLIIR